MTRRTALQWLGAVLGFFFTLRGVKTVAQTITPAAPLWTFAFRAPTEIDIIALRPLWRAQPPKDYLCTHLGEMCLGEKPDLSLEQTRGFFAHLTWLSLAFRDGELMMCLAVLRENDPVDRARGITALMRRDLLTDETARKLDHTVSLNLFKGMQSEGITVFGWEHPSKSARNTAHGAGVSYATLGADVTVHGRNPETGEATSQFIRMDIATVIEAYERADDGPPLG